VRALVTGFEPFGGDPVNASWEAVAALAARWPGSGVDDLELVTARLPVTFEGAGDALGRALAEHRPDVVVCTGLAAGSDAVRIERVALNLADARIPDNAGAQPVDEPVVKHGPTAYLTRLPVKATLAALHDAGIPAVVSHSAGTYVCNATFYVLAHLLTAYPDVRGGFVHVPRTAEERVAPGGLPVADLARALEIVVRTAADDAAGRVAEPALAVGALH